MTSDRSGPSRGPSKGPKPPFKRSFGKPGFASKSPPRATNPDRDTPIAVTSTDNDLIYGAHPVIAAIGNAKRKPVKLWATENGLARLKEDVKDLPIEGEIVHPRLLDHLLKSKDAVHQGLILEARPLNQPRLDQIDKSGLVVVLDQVTDPHNVGAIMRSCAAFNATALITTARHAAETNSVFFKAASGAYELVPYVTVTNLARALEELKTYGFSLIGLDSEAAGTMDDLKITAPLAVVLGAEGRGLRQLTRDTCDVVARLDMPGQIKSLNVSIAAALSLYALRHKI
ncbi:23S rRNA (guanosine(2251)-2'-O)-methyltransferase RlmB [Aestuariivirga litoralis]|uniref:23S rRNA (guanosine(2251)-2'-O)-methyltransferase RlmB n=1 Tax=Aestuariivirga litoralis TaxID=2650924 RepID=UPI0018C6A1B7|nr:23S rRNA (guanosine(2251)-2'-O)-methyltransferase RlmB [Aestuariivirga litoralis]MBG1231411.1 23S rRNA (guanosine(2251)-2'-O)-methyltransferase RlmB [Aestuariivirga litoralis]